MPRRSFFHHLRDGVFLAAAFAMVLYITVTDHRADGPGSRIAARGGAHKEARSFGENRLASAAIDATGP